MKQLRAPWAGALDCPIEQGFFGVSKVEAPAREDHLEGVARWAPFHRRRRVGWRGAGVARGRGTVGRGGRQARPDGGGVGGGGGGGRAARRGRGGGHDRGRVVRDLAVMLADGGDCLADLRAVREQEPLFSPVASDATAFRVVAAIAADPALLGALREARARARANAWNAGARPQRIVIDIDATLITAHSDKDG